VQGKVQSIVPFQSSQDKSFSGNVSAHTNPELMWSHKMMELHILLNVWCRH